jgi:hypothetical protein
MSVPIYQTARRIIWKRALGTLSCKPSSFKKRVRKVIIRLSDSGVETIKKQSEVELSEKWWFSKCFFVVFVVAVCIVYVLAAVVSFIVMFLYCVCALFVCNVCYLSVVLLYYCHRVKAQLQFNIYIYIYIYISTWTRCGFGGATKSTEYCGPWPVGYLGHLYCL